MDQLLVLLLATWGRLACLKTGHVDAGEAVSELSACDSALNENLGMISAFHAFHYCLYYNCVYFLIHYRF